MRIGIFGGGQLARMLVQASIPLGLETVVLAQRADEPAALITRNAVVGAWEDRATLDEFAAHVDVVILENEFIGAEKLTYLAQRGCKLVPSDQTLATIEDKAVQKQTLADAGLPVPPFTLVNTFDDVYAFGLQHGYPLMLKTRRNGYDGKGTAKITDIATAEAVCRSLGFPDNPLYLEAWVPFQAELATLVIRSTTGEQCVYPVVQTIQPNGVCRIVRAPAPFAGAALQEAKTVALAAADAVQATGILAIEMFLTNDNRILVNELAPRPHNTGHYSIEGCYTSQFENYLRAAAGLPLGDPTLRHPAAVMVNVLAPSQRVLDSSLIHAALRPKVHVHWYDKREARVGRKIGHITAVGHDATEVEQRAQSAVYALEQVLGKSRG